MHDTLQLSGQRAIVTGGASGIGLATARLLAGYGAKVVVLDRDPLPAGTDEALGHEPADVADDAQVRAAVARAVDALGGLDLLVSNAGIGAQGTVEDNDDEWHRVLDVNVVGMVRVARACLPALRRSNWACIVNTASVATTVGLPSRALCSATKGAVAALTRAMAADHLAKGIRVNCVNPGTADTPWVTRLLAQAVDPVAERAALVARQPHGRLVTAEEVALAVAYLASPLAGSLTGVALEVDGVMGRIRPRARTADPAGDGVGRRPVAGGYHPPLAPSPAP